MKIHQRLLVGLKGFAPFAGFPASAKSRYNYRLSPIFFISKTAKIPFCGAKVTSFAHSINSWLLKSDWPFIGLKPVSYKKWMANLAGIWSGKRTVWSGKSWEQNVFEKLGFGTKTVFKDKIEDNLSSMLLSKERAKNTEIARAYLTTSKLH